MKLPESIGFCFQSVVFDVTRQRNNVPWQQIRNVVGSASVCLATFFHPNQICSFGQKIFELDWFRTITWTRGIDKEEFMSWFYKWTKLNALKETIVKVSRSQFGHSSLWQETTCRRTIHRILCFCGDVRFIKKFSIFVSYGCYGFWWNMRPFAMDCRNSFQF